MEGKFDIADSIRIECEIGGELNARGKLGIGQKGVLGGVVRTVDGSPRAGRPSLRGTSRWCR